MTVLGLIRPDEMGVTLTHEHVLVDFIGADKISRDRYRTDDAFAKILPHLKQVRELGGRTLLECTPAYLGRDPVLLQRLAKAGGLHLLTNTGYYGAADNKFLPGHAFTESADQLAGRWLKEWREGIDGTKVRPGFIKIGVGGETLSDLHRKLVRAAARTHRASGLTIASHTGPAKLALEQLDVLREEGVGARAFVWVHAQAESDPAVHLKIAERGAWVSLDGYGPTETKRYVELLKALRDRGRLGQVLLSHDAGWYRPGEPEGGEFRPFDALFKVLLPKLKEEGFNQTEIDKVLVRNPAEAFTIRVRTP
jgi:phosphotriesterase-related protein